MKQILAIFSKDVRRFWPEILISLALVVAFVIVYPSQWRETGHVLSYSSIRFLGSSGVMGLLSTCLVILIPVGWWILTARVIHGERLVGDTQFWITRPYEWPKLLAAKLLFLAVFVCVPLFLAQSLLLSEAGFHPTSFVPGLSYNLLLVTCVLVLPLAAFSSITTGFGKMTLVLLGVILFIAGMALLSSAIPSDTSGNVPGSFGDSLSLWALTCGCAVAVLVQFATRKTWLAWLILATVAILLSAIGLTDPDQALMEHYYSGQNVSNSAPVQFSNYTISGSPQPVTNETKDKSELEIAVPVREWGVMDGHAVILSAFKATIEGSGGARWESPWQGVYNERYLPGTSDATMHFRIRRTVYERFKSGAVTLRLTFAVDDAQLAATRSIALPTREFFVPDIGICAPQAPWFILPPKITGIGCRSALRHPQLTYVTAQWTNGNCSSGESEKVLGTTWVGSFETDPAEFGITSVWDTPLNLSNSFGGYNQGKLPIPRQLCPGSPVTFTEYHRVARSQVGMTVQNFHLPELAIGDVYLLKMTD